MIKDREKEIIQKFEGLKTWEDRYKKIIELGKGLADLPDSLKTEESKVKGCQSQVWLHAKLSPAGTIEFRADSDALLVKGLVAVVLHVYSGATPEEILETPPDFVKRLGFDTNLSPSRANGLMAMIKQIRHFATAFAYMQKTRV